MSAILVLLVASCGILGDCDPEIQWIYDDCPEPEPIEHHIDPEELRQLFEAKRLRDAVSVEVGEGFIRVTNEDRVPIRTLHIEILHGEKAEILKMKIDELAPGETYDFPVADTPDSVYVVRVELLE